MTDEEAEKAARAIVGCLFMFLTVMAIVIGMIGLVVRPWAGMLVLGMAAMFIIIGMCTER